MDAVQYDIQIDIGRDYTQLFQFFDSVGAQMDLTGYSFSAEVREGESSSSGLIETFTIDVTDIAIGEITLSLTDTETSAISQDAGYFDIKVTDPTAIDETWVYGAVTFQGRPTT